jgi:hypothetical protein
LWADTIAWTVARKLFSDVWEPSNSTFDVSKEATTMEINSDDSPTKEKEKSKTTGKDKTKERINKEEKNNDDRIDVHPKVVTPRRKKVTMAPEVTKSPVKEKPVANVSTFFLSKNI